MAALLRPPVRPEYRCGSTVWHFTRPVSNQEQRSALVAGRRHHACEFHIDWRCNAAWKLFDTSLRFHSCLSFQDTGAVGDRIWNDWFFCSVSFFTRNPVTSGPEGWGPSPRWITAPDFFANGPWCEWLKLLQSIFRDSDFSVEYERRRKQYYNYKQEQFCIKCQLKKSRTLFGKAPSLYTIVGLSVCRKHVYAWSGWFTVYSLSPLSVHNNIYGLALKQNVIFALQAVLITLPSHLIILGILLLESQKWHIARVYLLFSLSKYFSNLMYKVLSL